MPTQNKELLEFLEQFVTERRKNRINNVLSNRTRYVTCVLEDLYDSRNGSAVLRHCDALGIQEIHAIENRNNFKSDEQVDMGSAQWLDLVISRKKNTGTDGSDNTVPANNSTEKTDTGKSRTPEVLRNLKKRGYRIVATSPHAPDDAVPETLDIHQGPVAVVFGSEKHGISGYVKQEADIFMQIPMYGFVESYNISASAAIVFYTIIRRLKNSDIDWRLTKEDISGLYFKWIKQSVPNAEQLSQEFFKRQNISG